MYLLQHNTNNPGQLVLTSVYMSATGNIQYSAGVKTGQVTACYKTARLTVPNTEWSSLLAQNQELACNVEASIIRDKLHVSTLQSCEPMLIQTLLTSPKKMQHTTILDLLVILI